MSRRILIALMVVTVMVILLITDSNISAQLSPTSSPTITPTFQRTIQFVSATPRPPTSTFTASPSPTISVTPSQTPTPTVTSIYTELRDTVVTDPELLVRFTLDADCFLVESEITGNITLRNLKRGAIYVYLSGQIAFSINNSPILPDFPPQAPSSRSEFELLEPNAEIRVFDLDDLGLFVQGMGPQSGIDFFETGTIFGLPPGEYWVTAAYSNPHDGLEQQFDGTYLIPQSAWRGVSLSREVRFSVVEDLSNCPG